jgi:hypothetical protein
MREPNEYQDSDIYFQEEKNIGEKYEPEIIENSDTELDEK